MAQALDYQLEKGNLHWLNAGISFVNGEYVNDPNLFLKR